MAEKILQRLMPKIIKELNLVNYDLKIEPISSGGANYTSTLYNITVTAGDKVIYMFGKVAAAGKKLRSQSPKVYETEKFVYTKLLKVYQKLEDDHNLSQEHRLIFPKFYGFHPETYKETIVLENLVMNGYQAHNRFKAYNWEYAKSAASSLAKMHALSFAYSEYYPEEFHKIVDNLHYEWDITNDQVPSNVEWMIKRAVKITREEHRDKLQRFFDSFEITEFPKFYKWLLRPVLGHGDYRPSNLMHKICEDDRVEVKIVDLQTLQGVSPAADLMYFIYTGSDEEFRAKYYEKLLDHYYTELHAAITRFHLNPDDVYSREDFHYELKKKLNFGLVLAVFALPIVTVDVENAPKVNEDMDLTTLSVEKTSELYTVRLNGIVNDYVKLGVLK